ncbi:MAG: pyridoxamine 5'-phosphate oxidase family protein [Nitrospinae bacterium]|nr:pyridoxamine 5'-phosphate oxidase family protein [Nitrospinota bacterium]
MRLKKAEQEFIALERVARLATVDREGTPHNVPICPMLARGRMYFASAKDAKKVRNIEGNASVALTFDVYAETWSQLRGVMVQGEARILEGGTRFRQMRALLYEKYRQYESSAPLEEGESVILEVIPHHVFSWGL